MASRALDRIILDPKIENIILKLNLQGLSTAYSCSGHKTKSGYSKGYITFIGLLDKKKLLKILTYLGLEDIKIRLGYCYKTLEVPSTTAYFNGLGGSRNCSGKPLDFAPSLTDLDANQIARLFMRNLHRVGIHHSSKQAIEILYVLGKTLQGKEVPKFRGGS